MTQQSLVEQKITHTFPPGWESTKFDNWAFYRNQFQGAFGGGNKAVDFLAFHPSEKTLWLIEVKDYREYRRKKGVRLWDEVAIKVRDTLACLYAARVNAGNNEYTFSDRVAKSKKLRVALHLEQPKQHSKLFPRVFDPADVTQKLKKLVKPVDAHPAVIEISRMDRVPWRAS